MVECIPWEGSDVRSAAFVSFTWGTFDDSVSRYWVHE